MADDPTKPPSPAGKGSAAKRGLQKRIGPLPLWAWGGLAIAGGIIYYSINKDKQQKKPTPSNQPTSSTASNYSTTPAVGTLASQVPQFVNQTYTNPTPQNITQTNTNTNKPPPTPPPPHKTPAPHHKGDGDNDADNHGGPPDSGPGGKGKTGGWKGQHSNGQGSHHGGPAPKPPTRPPHINPGGPIRGKGRPPVGV